MEIERKTNRMNNDGNNTECECALNLKFDLVHWLFGTTYLLFKIHTRKSRARPLKCTQTWTLCKNLLIFTCCCVYSSFLCVFLCNLLYTDQHQFCLITNEPSIVINWTRQLHVLLLLHSLFLSNYSLSVHFSAWLVSQHDWNGLLKIHSMQKNGSKWENENTIFA